MSRGSIAVRLPDVAQIEALRMITRSYFSKTMSEAIQSKRRGNPAMAKGAPSLNPNGRPPVRRALATAMRETFSEARIVELAEDLVLNAKSESVRLAALEFIANRADGKVATDVNLNATMAPAARLPSNWSTMNAADRDAYLDEVQRNGMRALSEGDRKSVV